MVSFSSVPSNHRFGTDTAGKKYTNKCPVKLLCHIMPVFEIFKNLRFFMAAFLDPRCIFNKVRQIKSCENGPHAPVEIIISAQFRTPLLIYVSVLIVTVCIVR